MIICASSHGLRRKFKCHIAYNIRIPEMAIWPVLFKHAELKTFACQSAGQVGKVGNRCLLAAEPPTPQPETETRDSAPVTHLLGILPTQAQAPRRAKRAGESARAISPMPTNGKASLRAPGEKSWVEAE